MTDAPYRPMTGAALKAFRESRSLSQQAFADLIGCSKKALGAYELDRADVPKLIGYACAAVAAGLQPIGQG